MPRRAMLGVMLRARTHRLMSSDSVTDGSVQGFG